jgi:hypothetical protein
MNRLVAHAGNLDKVVTSPYAHQMLAFYCDEVGGVGKALIKINGVLKTRYASSHIYSWRDGRKQVPAKLNSFLRRQVCVKLFGDRMEWFL